MIGVRLVMKQVIGCLVSGSGDFHYYYIAGKFDEFGGLSMFHQTKTIQMSTYNYNLLAESIHSPNFFRQMLETS